MQDVYAAAHGLDAHPVPHAPDSDHCGIVRGQRRPGGRLRATCLPHRGRGPAPHWGGCLPLAGGECRGGTSAARPDRAAGA